MISRRLRPAIVVAVAFALSFSPLFAAAPAATAQSAPTPQRVAATQIATVSAGSKGHSFTSSWQAKKKKRHVKIASPDLLPQPLVQIIPGSTINLLSRSSKLPLAIKNDYDSEVRVRVRVQPSNLKVLIPALVEVIVPANTTITAKVPVKAIADGPVILHATLESFSGIRLTVPVDIKMNVILGVEDTVLYGFIGFIALLGTFGVVRTIRKRRREGAAE